MNPTENLLVKLLDCAIHETPLPPECAANADWADVLEMAQSHHIDALLLDAALSLPEGMAPASDVRERWQALAMNTAMSQGALAIQASMLLSALDGAGIKAVMIKGMALKALYPQPDLRTMSDLDLLVAPAQQAAAHAAMEEIGYTVVEREPGVDVMRAPEGLRVELHERLFDKTEEGFLAKLDEQALFSVESAVRDVVAVAPKGAVIAVESTISPGTMDRVVRPIVEGAGLACGRDIHIAHVKKRTFAL